MTRVSSYSQGTRIEDWPDEISLASDMLEEFRHAPHILASRPPVPVSLRIS